MSRSSSDELKQDQTKGAGSLSALHTATLLLSVDKQTAEYEHDDWKEILAAFVKR